MNNQKGFTLIELIVVIVILGVLSAVAVPKFVDMQTEARIAAVEGLRGAISSASALGRGKCLVSSATCNSGAAYNATPNPFAVIDGDQVGFHFGNVKAWPQNGLDDITDIIDLSGFTAQNYVGGSYERVFTKDGAPNESACSVTYRVPTGAGSVVITVNNTGC